MAKEQMVTFSEIRHVNSLHLCFTGHMTSVRFCPQIQQPQTNCENTSDKPNLRDIYNPPNERSSEVSRS